MGTKPQDVTELKFYNVEDIMRITGWKQAKSYQVMSMINKKLKAQGKLTLKGRVLKTAFEAQFI